MSLIFKNRNSKVSEYQQIILVVQRLIRSQSENVAVDMSCLKLASQTLFRSKLHGLYQEFLLF